MKTVEITRNQSVNLTKEGITRISISTGFRHNVVNCQIDLYAIAFNAMDKGTILKKEKLLQEHKEKKKVTVELRELSQESQEVQRIIFIDEIYAVDSVSKAEPPYFIATSEEKTWQFNVSHEIGWHRVIVGFELYRSNNDWYLRVVGNSVRHRLFRLMKAEYYDN